MEDNTIDDGDSMEISPDEKFLASVDAKEESENSSVSARPNRSPEITFQGNSYDLMSVVGVSIGGMTLFTCATCNLGFYCLPIIPVILGLIGLVAAKVSVDPERTKLLSWIGIGTGGLIILIIITFIALYIGLYAFIIFMALAAEGGGF